MTNKIQLKRSVVPGKVPTTSDLGLGEIAINHEDGKMYVAKTTSGAITSITEIGAGVSSTFDGLNNQTLSVTAGVPTWTYPLIAQNAQTGPTYTMTLADGGGHVYLTYVGVVTVTIPANASVAFPIGTSITIINKSGSVASIAITSDTLYLAGTGSTGARSLANYGVATLLKTTATNWFISGNGLT